MGLIIGIDEEEKVGKSWKSLAYTVMPLVNQQGQLFGIAGRVDGIRDDDLRPFILYAFPLIWPFGFDWTGPAKERMDTFLNCNCSAQFGSCSYHQVACQRWDKEDQLRIQVMPDDIPDALRGIMAPPQQAENQKSKIIIPS